MAAARYPKKTCQLNSTCPGPESFFIFAASIKIVLLNSGTDWQKIRQDAAWSLVNTTTLICQPTIDILTSGGVKYRNVIIL
jgi:3-keto-L-gulonate-6-phosphate decarboxylase